MSESPFKMKGFSGFRNSPLKQTPKNFNMKGGPSKTPGFDTTKIAKTIKKVNSNSWLTKYGKTLLKGVSKKALGTIGTYLGSMSAAKATQPGTGTHGGTKTPKLKDIDK